MEAETIHGSVTEMEEQAEEELRRGEKRDREQTETSSDDGWIIQGKGRKVTRSSTAAEIEEKIQVSVTSDQPLPKQFALARLFKDSNIRSVSRVKYVHAYKMLLSFDVEVSADVFINCQAFADMGWRSQKTTEVGLSYGVIKDIDIDLPEDEVKKNLLSEEEIISVKRLKKRNMDNTSKDAWVNSESVRVGFKGSRLPTHVAILGIKVKIEPYVFPVTQCSRCWKFGHNTIRCPAKKVTCPKCTKSHANCEIDSTKFRCVNCTGNHMALQRTCPVFKKERRIRELMSEFNCTYKQALSMYVPPSPVSVRVSSPTSGFPPLNTQRPAPTQSARPPVQLGKLMSDLFKPVDEVQVCTTESTPVSHRKQMKRTRGAAPATSRARDDDEDWFVPHECDSPLPLDDSDSVGKKKTDFIHLLIRLKDIILSKKSLEVKLREICSTAIEWIISKISSNVSASSLMSTFMNVVINEHG